MFLVIPSVSYDQWMNETQSTKTFIFLYGVIGIGVLAFIRFIFQKSHWNLKINFLDVLLSVWVLYTVINGFFHAIPFSLRILDLAGLTILYIILRQIQQKYYLFLFLALVLGGLIQAVYGNLQLWGFYPSHHGLFKMTGSFFNPGPYAGYLAGVFSVALGAYLFNIRILSSGQVKSINRKIHNIKSEIIRFLSKDSSYFSNYINRPEEPLAEKQQVKSGQINNAGFLFVLVIVAILLVIPASRSRASWLAVIASSCFLFVVKYKTFLQDLYTRFFNSAFKKVIAGILVVLFAGISLWGLYHYKKGSADGRLLIWKVTAGMIQDYPFTGVGFDRYKAHYMNYQAGYFQENPDSQEAMVAGDTNYAFNEVLQLTAENGFFGLLLIFIILFIAFPGEFSKPDTTSEKESNANRLIIIAKAGMISSIVFGLFAYPLQILPVKISFVLFLATVSGAKKSISKPNWKAITATTYKNLVPVMGRIGITVLILFGTGWAIKQLTIYTKAYKNWNSAYQLYRMSAYEASIKEYKKAYPVLQRNGDFLTNYGKALSMAGEHSEAVKVLQKTTEIYPNIVVYTALGDSYKNINGPGRAEKAYLHAWYMNPSKFYPKYLLAKLYDETGQTDKAVYTANELLEKEVKIESTAIREIHEEMHKIIEKGKL